MKTNRIAPFVTVTIVAFLCIVAALAAGLQGVFAFGAPLWTPGVTKLTPPTPTPETTYTQPPSSSKPTTVGAGVTFSWLPLAIILGILLLAVLFLLALYWWRSRRSRAPKRLVNLDGLMIDVAEAPSTEQLADLPVLHRGLVHAAEILQDQREPRDAIVRAWLGLQEAAEDSGLRRRASETPTEFTTRVFASVDADRDAASALLEVYLRVRFGTVPATTDDLKTARAAIARLRETWPVVTDE